MAAPQPITNQQHSYEVFGTKHYMECTTIMSRLRKDGQQVDNAAQAPGGAPGLRPTPREWPQPPAESPPYGLPQRTGSSRRLLGAPRPALSPVPVILLRSRGGHW